LTLFFISSFCQHVGADGGIDSIIGALQAHLKTQPHASAASQEISASQQGQPAVDEQLGAVGTVVSAIKAGTYSRPGHVLAWTFLLTFTTESSQWMPALVSSS
jgi:hypothetical protein